MQGTIALYNPDDSGATTDPQSQQTMPYQDKKMELEDVKIYLNQSFQKLGQCFKSAFSEVRAKIETIHDWSDKLSVGLDDTITKMEEQEKIM